MSVAEMNEAVLQAVEEHALTPEAVEQVIALTERDDAQEQQAARLRELKDIDKRIARLTTAVETAGDITALVDKLRDLQTKRTAVAAALAGLQPLPRLTPNVVENRLAEWRRLLRQSTTQARAVLQRVLRGRLTFTPRADGRGYDFSAPTRFDKIFAGIAVPRPAWIPKGGVPEHIGPDDTFDTDYGRVLERFYGLGVTSPAGFDRSGNTVFP